MLFLPFVSADISETDRPDMLLPSTLIILSPDFKPAFSAGEFFNTSLIIHVSLFLSDDIIICNNEAK